MGEEIIEVTVIGEETEIELSNGKGDEEEEV